MKFDIYKIADNYKLTDTERQVLEYILNNSTRALDMGVRDVAGANYTSAATVMKLSKKLGYTGYVDMVYRLNFMIQNRRSNRRQESELTSFIADIEEAVLDHYVELLHRHQENIIYITATGFSAPVADFICRKLLVLGYRCIRTDSYEVYESNRQDGNMVLAVSKTGATDSVNKVIDYAAENGMDIIAFTGSERNYLAGRATVHFEILDDGELDDRNITANYFYARVLILFEYLMNKVKELP